MPGLPDADRLARLRRRIAEIETSPHREAVPGATSGWIAEGLPHARHPGSRIRPLAGRHACIALTEHGRGAVDAALGGGLARGALHEACANEPRDLGALTGFALGVAAGVADGTPSPVLWIQQGRAAHEGGGLYGPGLAAFGLDWDRLLLVRARTAREALWAMEEGLKSAALAAVVAEFEASRAADLTATRRLSLAARASGGLGLLLRHRPSLAPVAAATRWRIATAPSVAVDPFGGLGRTALDLALTRNRHGPCGRWTLAWNAHDRLFAETAQTLPVDLAAPAGHRPHRAAHAA